MHQVSKQVVSHFLDQQNKESFFPYVNELLLHKAATSEGPLFSVIFPFLFANQLNEMGISGHYAKPFPKPSWHDKCTQMPLGPKSALEKFKAYLITPWCYITVQTAITCSLLRGLFLVVFFFR